MQGMVAICINGGRPWRMESLKVFLVVFLATMIPSAISAFLHEIRSSRGVRPGDRSASSRKGEGTSAPRLLNPPERRR